LAKRHRVAAAVGWRSSAFKWRFEASLNGFRISGRRLRLTDVYTNAYSRFSWDHRKSDQNLRDRGFDLEFSTLVFEGPTLEREDDRRGYGERRIVAIGLAQGIPLTVVFTDRTEAGVVVVRRIISARLSNRRERQAYSQALSQE